MTMFSSPADWFKSAYGAGAGVPQYQGDGMFRFANGMMVNPDFDNKETMKRNPLAMTMMKKIKDNAEGLEQTISPHWTNNMGYGALAGAPKRPLVGNNSYMLPYNKNAITGFKGMQQGQLYNRRAGSGGGNMGVYNQGGYS